MFLSKEDQQHMVSIIKQREYEDAYHFVTGYSWWADETMTTNMERENFLYQAFVSYYNLLFVEGVKGIENKDEALEHLHRLKCQLQEELNKVKKNDFVLI
ncbi:hypothetical protein [Niallia taxi]|uniref:hypothetical protein n=1 Tax=Niallia taxi TaxID=2499688 RepID=UPI0015F417CB|nr:hypothetical protein [Niallia taxi]